MNFDFETMQYPLKERIGVPDLLAGREAEFRNYHKWISGIPKEISNSRVIISRKKSGKTAFIQRLYNQIWSSNGQVIPFYMEISERKMWLPDFAMIYFETFASQYIAFLERDSSFMKTNLKCEEIKAYGKRHSISLLVKDVERIESFLELGRYDSLWELGFTAPHRYANQYNQRVLVILDEFQNTNGFIYSDQEKQILDETIPGSYHEVSESKIAPMLITGSNVKSLLPIVRQNFQITT